MEPTQRCALRAKRHASTPERFRNKPLSGLLKKLAGRLPLFTCEEINLSGTLFRWAMATRVSKDTLSEWAAEGKRIKTEKDKAKQGSGGDDILNASIHDLFRPEKVSKTLHLISWTCMTHAGRRGPA